MTHHSVSSNVNVKNRCGCVGVWMCGRVSVRCVCVYGEGGGGGIPVSVSVAVSVRLCVSTPTCARMHQCAGQNTPAHTHTRQNTNSVCACLYLCV